MVDQLAARRPKHDGVMFATAAVRVHVAAPARRVSLRALSDSLAPLSKALKLTLPTAPKTSASAGGRAALWLGPDEWLVIDDAGGDPLGDCAVITALHSAVDVSHRNVAFIVSGPAAEAVISAGCPQDVALAAFPVGACSRTVFGKIEVVLLRTAEDSFRVECWRSFADYLSDFLSEAAKDAG